ncbi:Gfo/Idh/MocA family protein [Vagococcus zengguangii]|uniref:Gfo/Idh/MocA family oxidoreductase n=1 Tax=Vagococcus zengguangii TaxID=2571750 RepID=A0A4D7CUX7_9ENTE|nr:Gfo/Idh/MocA family oxidoreductase [Vagococcus zengguangii]QCI87213.1 Gfo/Idh/MocA family oxidoreductase [Vagococcus zengguangii]TLG80717.1 Gfo/Idh/MocA family oxidoreductase [Vagococcus zengguangii]
MKKRIGLIGVGNISQKAYMPIIQTLVDYEWVLYSRDEARLNDLRHRYQISEGYTSISELIASNLDACFVQSPTPTHYPIIKELLLAGISVFVDKPVSEEFSETQELFELANERGCLLFIGFNRRYAPKVNQLKQELLTDFHVTSFKHRINQPQPVKFALYDLFIHPLDTCLFLMNAEKVEVVSVDAHLIEEELHYISVQLTDGIHHATVAMNLVSGANREVLDVGTPSQTIVIENLEKETRYTSDGQQIQTFTDWDTTLYKRGFEPMIHDFLRSLENHILSSNQVATLATHRLVEEILAQLNA